MARKTAPIRVGLIRCDQRAFWYGAIFDDVDPLRFSAYDNAAYHHFTYYSSVELRHRRAEGFQLVKVFDPDPEAAERVALAFHGRPKVCSTLEEVSEGVDLVFIANASGSGEDHLKLARPGIRKGVPTFVDRPLADSLQAARALINLAKRHQAPLLSCSHLTMLPHAARFKARFPEVGPLKRGVIIGQGLEPTAIADGIALALHLFGPGVESVESMGRWPLELLHLQYHDQKAGHQVPVLVVNSHLQADRHAVFASAHGYAGRIYSDPMDDFAFPEGGLAVLNVLQEMVQTGHPPLPYEALLESVAIAEVGQEVHNQGTFGSLKDRL
jgi:hypothetical protein